MRIRLSIAIILFGVVCWVVGLLIGARSQKVNDSGKIESEQWLKMKEVYGQGTYFILLDHEGRVLDVVSPEDSVYVLIEKEAK